MFLHRRPLELTVAWMEPKEIFLLSRCLTKNTTANIELELSRPVCLELYQDCRDLGRFMLRYGGKTIAAGIVTEVGMT